MWKSGKLEIGWGFAAMVLLALLAGAGGVLPLVLLSALCHELGHLAALRLAGTEVELLRLTAFGAEIRADTRYLPYPKEILCTLAGPAVNLVLALVFARIAGDYVLAGANLLLLGWFKYAGFLSANLSRLGVRLDLPPIVLPIGISFFTFQALSYVLDVPQGGAGVRPGPYRPGPGADAVARRGPVPAAGRAGDPAAPAAPPETRAGRPQFF